MKIQRAYKTEIDPNADQLRGLMQHCGASRFVYNWGLAQCVEDRKAGRKHRSGMTLDKELRSLKDTDPAFMWLQGVSSQARQAALAHLDRAYQNFFRRCKTGAKHKGFPRFHSRKRGIGSFTVYGSAATETHIRLPNIGWVKLKEYGYIPTALGASDGVTVSERAGRWYVSVQMEVEQPDPAPGDRPVVGVDLGIKTLATVSDGTVIENPKALRRNMRKLKRTQRAVSRKQLGSANRRKAVARLATLHARIANIRSDATHKATTMLARKSSVIVLEDLNVRGMTANHSLAGAVSDANFAEFRRQVEYKASWYGARVVIADRFFPSSKTCSRCGNVKEVLTLDERIYHCEECGFTVDRDLNAAMNLSRLAVSLTDRVNACGEGSADINLRVDVKLPSMKRESLRAGVAA